MRRSHIELTKDEYVALLEMLEMSSWVLFAYQLDDRPNRRKYQMLHQRIMSLAPAFGCEDLVEFSERFKEYFPTRELETRCETFINEFENDTFWEELADRLTMRDVIRKVGEEKYRSMEFEQRMHEIDPVEQRYWDEFEEHGLDRIEIVE